MDYVSIAGSDAPPSARGFSALNGRLGPIADTFAPLPPNDQADPDNRSLPTA